MKNLFKPAFIKYGFLMLVLTVANAIAWAQDSTTTAVTTTSSTKTTEQTWYAEPWVWVAGAAVLILLIIALTRGSSNSSGRTDKVTVTKTSSTEVE